MENLRKRFRKEYLSQLVLKRNVQEDRKINTGDVVLIGDDNYKRIDWPLARVEELIKGRDHTSRVAILKTKDGKLKRPIQRIYPLEIHQNDINIIDLREKANKNKVKTKVNKVKVIKSNKSIKDIDSTVKSCEENDIENTVKTRSGRVVKNQFFIVEFRILILSIVLC